MPQEKTPLLSHESPSEKKKRRKSYTTLSSPETLTLSSETNTLSSKVTVIRLITILFVLLITLFIFNTKQCPSLKALFFLPPEQTDLPPPVDAVDLSDLYTPGDMRFSIKHIFHHNTDKPNGLAAHGRLDITPNNIAMLKETTPLVTFGRNTASPRKVSPWEARLALKPRNNFHVRRLADRHPDSVEALVHYANTYMDRGLPEIKNENLNWHDENIAVPDIEDRNTVVALAVMSSDAYVDIPNTGDWQNVTGPWRNETSDFGWAGEGVRGHVFVSEADEAMGLPAAGTVVIAIKGTSAAVFDDGGDTAPNDKINDNLLFSCCCARVSYLWNTVCDCYTGKSYTCNQDCLERELYKRDRYYKAAMDIYRNVSAIYPSSDIWITGHSLGGSLASLVGRTYGLPTVTYEAPGELLPSRRLHLPMPPGVPRWAEHIWHFGHTADPIFVGTCNGAGSSCWVAGYAMETVCHSGLECAYDVVSDKGWHVSLMNHRIHVVIDDVLLAYNDTATCGVPKICSDCFDWTFVSDNDDDSREPIKSSSTKTSISTKTVSTRFTSTTFPTASVTPSTPVAPPDNDDDTSPKPSDPPQVCKRRSWYGWCLEWGPEN
ncbi:uncharacterized protein SAPINGB_P000449 [Magnusiomyces paraingens]|uniref:Putative lipase ATG15 n=1 Tax=Magnusiomyces paraingens TaxID=2606893 RepID=A0A5E8B5I1_9ASCO|nr:uncharacterized protein SAPINGB_P000449 [Saprochaete ingens]VVT44536.1 unnamed protein product [Saprochaete ingens]